MVDLIVSLFKRKIGQGYMFFVNVLRREKQQQQQYNKDVL